MCFDEMKFVPRTTCHSSSSHLSRPIFLDKKKKKYFDQVFRHSVGKGSLTDGAGENNQTAISLVLVEKS